MRVNELIKVLEKIRNAAPEQDLRVCRNGFDECGIDEIGTVQLMHIRPVPRKGLHDPEFEEVTHPDSIGTIDEPVEDLPDDSELCVYLTF